MSDRPSHAVQSASVLALPARDRYTWIWLFVFLYFLLLAYSQELDRIFNLWLALVPLLLAPAIAIVCCWLIALMLNIAWRRWRRLIAQIVAPFAALALFTLLGTVGVNPERIRFEVNRRSYEAGIARLPRTGEPRFHTFDWGGTGGVAVPNFVFTLVFDESDEIGLPPEQRSTWWRKRVTALICPNAPLCWPYETVTTAVTVKRITGHFFVVTELTH